MSNARKVLNWLAVGVVAMACGHLGRSQAAEAKRPNIVFILIDDLGWADVGCFGSKYYETPNIDRLAAQGMRFTDAYAACAVCSPTRASIMTGKYPARLHLTDWIPGEGDAPTHALLVPEWRQFLPLEEVTIAKALKPAGYVSRQHRQVAPGRPASTIPSTRASTSTWRAATSAIRASYFWPYEGKTHTVPGLKAAASKAST